MSDTTPSWNPDPSGAHDHRYWDGTQWTEHVADAGVASIDPYEATTPEPAADEPAADEPAADEPSAPEPTADEPVTQTPVDEPWTADPAVEERWPLLPEASDDLPPEPEPLAPVDPTVVDPTVVEPVLGDTDTTATWPTTSGVAAAWASSPDGPDAPAPPPPYVPGEPVTSGSASKRRLVIGGGILAAVAVVAIAVLAFGGGDDPPKANANGGGGGGGNSSSSTTTTAPAPDGSYGSDAALDELYDSCDDGDYSACDKLYTDSDPGSEYESFGDTCGNRNEPGGYCVDIYGANSDEGSSTDPGSSPVTGIDPSQLPEDFEDTLADTYESTLNLDRDKAECLAGKVTDAITSGSLGENQAMSEFMRYFSDCDISLEEIGSN